MTTKDSKKSKASTVLDQLQHDIVSGRFSPGEKLSMDLLKEVYGIGYSPLREALSRLANNGLVQSEDQRGFCVAPLSLEEMYDLYHIRMHVEVLALEKSMQYGDDNWEADVVAGWHRYSKYLNSDTHTRFDPNQWEVLQKEFTTTLIKACHSPWLLKIRDMLYDHATRYRFLCIANHYDNKKLLLQFRQEKEALVSAVLSRDKKKAIALTKACIENVVTVIAQSLQKNTI